MHVCDFLLGLFLHFVNMAADQRKKRLNAASIVGHTSQEQHRAKKKKLRMPQYDLSMRSNISLEWDDKKTSVFAKREQVGISWKDLIPFIDAGPCCHNILADVFTVPRGIFELENLSEVFSLEVWQTQLSENERNLLTQYLPKGSEAHKVVQELLAGDNFHFGNPFLKWGSSLCSGKFHPDAILHWEKCLKTDKKAYYSKLQKYHNDMIGNLQMWKERWASCKDPEKEILQKIWSRSRKHAEKSMPTSANESRLHDPDENLVATSESCSWAADEKQCSSDNLNSMIHGEPQSRICWKGFTEGTYDNSSDGLKVVARARKGEKLPKLYIQCGDGAKYMSYIKVSKEQHQRVKSSMKHSSNSIQPRSLNHVLGNLDTFHVQPYEVFEEEQRQKLHDHWLQLANRDLPAGFANWRRRQLQKWQLTESLEQEMEEKLKSLKKDEEENPCNMVLEQTDAGAADLEPPTITIVDEEKGKSDSLLQEKMENGAVDYEPLIALECQDVENENHDCILQDQRDNGAANDEPAMENYSESFPASTQSPQLQQIPSPSGSHEFHHMDMNSEKNNVTAKTDDVPRRLSVPENMNNVDVSASQGNPLSSAGDVWPGVSVAGSYYHSTSVNHEYSSANELSLGHPQVMEEQPAQMIDLESGMREEQTGKDMLHRQSNDDSFFGAYPNQDRNELLHSFFKGQGNLPYLEQKQTGLDFQPAANVMMETGHFPGHFQEQLHPSMPSELRQKRLDDLYMHQNIQDNMYSNGSRYAIPRQDHLLPLNVQEWAANTVRISAPPQPHLSGGELLSQNWFSGEHQGRGVWSGPEGAVVQNQSIGNGSNADQSLFSVLSQCNELRSGAPYDLMGSTEQFTQSGDYGGVGGGGVPSRSNVLPQTANPLNYLSGHEAAAALKTNNIGWMSLPQNSALQDSIGKPFLRSWNH